MEHQMKYEISLADSGKYVICKVLDPVTTEFALEFGSATAEFSRQHGLDRQLYDCRRVRNIDSVYHNYEFAYKQMEQLELSTSNKVAILVDPADRSHDFVQIALRNAGYNVKIFVDEEQASEWLEA
jgi:hypothetical protein